MCSQEDRRIYGNDLDLVEYMRMVEREREVILEARPSKATTPEDARVHVMVRSLPPGTATWCTACHCHVLSVKCFKQIEKQAWRVIVLTGENALVAILF
jgi:hypothetical protein